MLEKIEFVKPEDIEKRSFEIITSLLGEKKFSPEQEPIIKRVIHTTADFEYADIMKFSEDAVKSAVEAIRSGCSIVTDTRMVEAGISKKTLAQYGGKVQCFIDHPDVASEAREKSITRAALSMDRAALDPRNRIFAIGNAPTALIRLYELIQSGKVKPALVIGVPVGFVNVVESKALFMRTKVPYIVSEGRKGGSTVAVSIVNAILYMMGRK